MNKEELHKFNNRFNSFALAFEQLKKDQHRNSMSYLKCLGVLLLRVLDV